MGRKLRRVTTSAGRYRLVRVDDDGRLRIAELDCPPPGGYVSARTCGGRICGVDLGQVEVWLPVGARCNDTGAPIYQPGVPRTFGMGGLCWFVDQPQLPTDLDELPPDAILIADSVEKRCLIDGQTPACGDPICAVPWAYFIMRPCQCEDDDAPEDPRVLACPALIVDAWSRGVCFTASNIASSNSGPLAKCRTARELWIGVPQPGDIVLTGDQTDAAYTTHTNCCDCCAGRPQSPCEWTPGPLPPLSQPPAPPFGTDLCEVNVTGHGIDAGVCCNPLTAVGQITGEFSRGTPGAVERRVYAGIKQLNTTVWEIRHETYLPGIDEPIVSEYTKPFRCDCRLYMPANGVVCHVAAAFDPLEIWEGNPPWVTRGVATVTPTTIEVETEAVPPQGSNGLPGLCRFSLTQQVTETDCGPNECVQTPPRPPTAPPGSIDGPPGSGDGLPTAPPPGSPLGADGPAGMPEDLRRRMFEGGCAGCGG